MPPTARGTATAYLVLAVMPLFFSSNLIFGRVAIETVEPWTLACLRWSLAFCLLLPFVWRDLVRYRAVFVARWKLIAGLGVLGMWICGALVYFALRHTTATNGTLIYTSSPVLIVLFEWLFRGRSISVREIIGIPLAFLGVVVIVVRGSLDFLLALSFNIGDIVFAFAALSWAVYSVLLKRRSLAGLPPMSLFAAVALAGAIALLPFMILESLVAGAFPTGLQSWTSIAGIVVFSSVLAFSCFQYGIHTVGPSVSGLFMYLLPPYGVAMAVVFLGETLETFHIAGFLLIMAGILLATLPVHMIRNIKKRGPDHSEAGL